MDQIVDLASTKPLPVHWRMNYVWLVRVNCDIWIWWRRDNYGYGFSQWETTLHCIIGSGCGFCVACTAPSHYLNHCWFIFSQTLWKNSHSMNRKHFHSMKCMSKCNTHFVIGPVLQLLIKFWHIRSKATADSYTISFDTGFYVFKCK